MKTLTHRVVCLPNMFLLTRWLDTFAISPVRNCVRTPIIRPSYVNGCCNHYVVGTSCSYSLYVCVCVCRPLLSIDQFIPDVVSKTNARTRAHKKNNRQPPGTILHTCSGLERTQLHVTTWSVAVSKPSRAVRYLGRYRHIVRGETRYWFRFQR